MNTAMDLLVKNRVARLESYDDSSISDLKLVGGPYYDQQSSLTVKTLSVKIRLMHIPLQYHHDQMKMRGATEIRFSVQWLH